MLTQEHRDTINASLRGRDWNGANRIQRAGLVLDYCRRAQIEHDLVSATQLAAAMGAMPLEWQSPGHYLDMVGALVAFVKACDTGAHLIAATPELLRALQSAVERCPCSVAERASGHRIDCAAPAWIELIDKATGAQS